jgi:hypothetical protein
MPTDLTVTLEDRPGILAAACEALGQAGINIEGCCAYRHEGASRLHVLVGDAAAARAALADAGYDVIGERNVLVIELEDRPGAAGETLRRIAAKGINLDLVYLATWNRLVVASEDPQLAEVALKD